MEGMFNYVQAEEVFTPNVGQAIALSKGVQTTEALGSLFETVGKAVTMYKEYDDRESKIKAQNDQHIKLAEIASSNVDANTKYAMVHASMSAVEEGVGKTYTKAYADTYKVQMGQYLDNFAAKARVETQFNTVNDITVLGSNVGEWTESSPISKGVHQAAVLLGDIGNSTDITARTKLTEKAYEVFNKLNNEDQQLLRDPLSSVNYKNKELEQKFNDTLSNQKDQWRNAIDETTLGNRTNLSEATKWVASERAVLNRFRNKDGSFDSEQHRRKENQILDVEFMIGNKRQSLQKEGEARAREAAYRQAAGGNPINQDKQKQVQIQNIVADAVMNGNAGTLFAIANAPEGAKYSQGLLDFTKDDSMFGRFDGNAQLQVVNMGTKLKTQGSINTIKTLFGSVDNFLKMQTAAKLMPKDGKQTLNEYMVAMHQTEAFNKIPVEDKEYMEANWARKNEMVDVYKVLRQTHDHKTALKKTDEIDQKSFHAFKPYNVPNEYKIRNGAGVFSNEQGVAEVLHTWAVGSKKDGIPAGLLPKDSVLELEGGVIHVRNPDGTPKYIRKGDKIEAFRISPMDLEKASNSPTLLKRIDGKIQAWNKEARNKSEYEAYKKTQKYKDERASAITDLVFGF